MSARLLAVLLVCAIAPASQANCPPKGFDRSALLALKTRLSFAFGEAVTAFRAALNEPMPEEFSESVSSTEPANRH